MNSESMTEYEFYNSLPAAWCVLNDIRDEWYIGPRKYIAWYKEFKVVEILPKEIIERYSSFENALKELN